MEHITISESIVKISNLRFLRGERIIFDNVNMTFQRGKVTAIMGPSGSGKTTLLRLIGRLLHPEEGSIEVNGIALNNLKHKEMLKMRRRMGLLFQSSALFSDLSVYENVAFPLRQHTKLSDEMIRDIVLMKLQAVGLRGASQLMPSELSGGMARRVALARAIALDPDIIMYDEPFTGQDPIAMGVLVQLIRLLNDALGMTSIIVSHDVQETLSIADYIYVIANGKVIGEGTPHALLNATNPQLKQFIQGLPDGPVPFHYPARDYTAALLNSWDD
jgi:phospholipid/cholesterol/gamma-HCH transport system ATP-binding protein